MIKDNQLEEDLDKLEKICDSPRNKSRITVEYVYHPISDLLGKGGYGEVYKVNIVKSLPTQTYYALKVFDKNTFYDDEEKGFRILNEIKIHRSLNHAHICKYEHSFEDQKNVYILMEYCENGTLASMLKSRVKLEEIEIRFYMFQVLLVLKYFRRHKIVHRDLTLGNIFLKDYKTVKIGDFGFAFKENDNDEKPGLICGTPGYYTPESNLPKYNYKTDIFDFGVCIYYLFGGKLQLQTSQQSYDFFTLHEFQVERHVKLSEDAFDLLKNIIALENKRLDLDKIFEHPFFNKGKGLSKETFPDYNDKDYMNKIEQLTQEFQIKPMPKEKLIKQIKKPTYTDSSSSSSSSEKIIQKIENKKIVQRPRNVTFNMNILYNKFGKNPEEFKQNLRKSLKDSNGILNLDFENLKLQRMDSTHKKSNNNKFLEDNNNRIDFENTLGGNKIENEESNSIDEEKYQYYYNMYKTFTKLSLSDIIYVTKFYDNLRKYCGIGYELNNKNIGIIFNDDTQMTKLTGNLQYIFYHKKDYEKNTYQHVSINLPPKNLSRNNENKIKFLWKVIEEFKTRKNKEKYFINKYKIEKIEDDIFIVKYKKTNKGYFFLFSNKNIQVSYFDGTKILFNYFPKGIAYISNDKNNTITIFPLNENQNFNLVDCEDSFINSKINYAIGEILK